MKYEVEKEENNNNKLAVINENSLSIIKKENIKTLFLIIAVLLAIIVILFTIKINIKKENEQMFFSEFKLLKDTNPPVITLEGKKMQNCVVQYKEEGYKAIDPEDGDLTDKVEISKEVDSKTNIEYITYTVIDSSNNKSYITRVINHNDVTKPKIKVIGRKNEKLIYPSYYINQKPKVTDNKDSKGTLYKNLETEQTVNLKKTGAYNIEYKVKDTAGNECIESKKIEVINNTKKKNPKVYLTFDDGPCAYTNILLDVLKKHNVKATFFVSCNMSSYAHILKRIDKEGHNIALHTYSHVYKQIYASDKAFINDLNKVGDIVYTYTKKRPKLFRFAGGASNTVSRNYNKGIMTRLDRITKEKGYVYTDWNVDSMDTSRGITSEDIKWNVINGISNKQYSIVLQHDIHLNSVNAVDSIIKEAKARGYTFDVLDENSPIYQHKIVN